MTMDAMLRKTVLDGLHSWVAAPPKGTGGTVSARYCYSVFLRHRTLAARHGLTSTPRCVVEFGPGDSLGIGLMALLTGSEELIAVDAVRHASVGNNLTVFDGLVALLHARADIPVDGDCAGILPRVDERAFPAALFDPVALEAALAPPRLARLRATLVAGADHTPVRYLAPWGALDGIADGSVDWVLSQAVMEHVDDPATSYRAAWRCLRPGGVMSHQIDLRSHDTASEWNGHWTYPAWLWKLMRGRRDWFVNRLPCSAHLRMQRDAGFLLQATIEDHQPNRLERRRLAAPFAHLNDADLQTAGVMTLAVR